MPYRAELSPQDKLTCNTVYSKFSDVKFQATNWPVYSSCFMSLFVLFSFSEQKGADLTHMDNFKHAKLLEAISLEFVTKEATQNLATKLLNGLDPMGGAAFISNRYFNGEKVKWPEMAFTVLNHWALEESRRHSIVYGKVLLDAIEKSKPDAAHKFVNQLLDENGEIFFLLSV